MTTGRRPAVRALALVVVLGALLLAGCTHAVDGAGARLVPPRASDLLARTATTMAGLASGFTVTVRVDLGDDPLTEQIRLQGDDAAGTVTRQGERAELRRAGGTSFAEAGAAFWRLYGLDANQAESIDGVWTELPTGFGLAERLRRPAYYETLADDQDSRYTSVRSGDVDGTRVWVLSAGGGTTISVTTGPAPRLRQMAVDDNTVDFSYPTGDLQVEAPENSEPFPG